MNDSAWIVTTVIYCTLRRQFWSEVAVPTAATVRDAILRSNVLPRTDRQALEQLEVCVSGVPAALGAPVSTGTTIEIYRVPRGLRHRRRARR